MTDEEVLERFPSDVGKGPKGVAHKTIAAAREQGVLRPEDELQAAAVLTKYSPAILLISVGLFLFLQKNCVVLVSTRHVVFTMWTAYGGEGAVAKTCRLDRPVQLTLSKEPKKGHFFGNRVKLPPKVADFLGKDAIQAPQGLVADEAFRVARAPAG